jgi:hypothetical protein
VIKAGPAPRPMDLMALAIQNGNLVADTGRIAQRTRYQPSQALRT